MFKLTMVSIIAGWKRYTAFIHLPVVNGKVHYDMDIIRREFKIPAGKTCCLGG